MESNFQNYLPTSMPEKGTPAYKAANDMTDPTENFIAPRLVAPTAPATTGYARRAMVSDEMHMPHLGALDALMRDDTISDILVSGTEPVYIDRGGKLVDSGVRFANHEEVWQVAERIMEAVNQPWDPSRPMIDTRLPDGSRVNLVGPPIAIDGVSISIRKFPSSPVTIDTMAAQGQISQELGEFLKECVHARMNIIISGSTGAGKTTLLNALSAAIPHAERIVTIEDSAELRLQRPHVVRLESKAPHSEDDTNNEITMRALVRNALRMRPNRIIVGESRGAEAFDVLQAMNTGHNGSMTTLHANSPRDAMARLETMIMSAVVHMPLRMVRQQITSSVNLVLQVSRSSEGRRHISHITEVCGLEGEMMVMQDLMTYVEASPKGPAEYRWNGNAPRNPVVTEAARKAEIFKSLR